ncbi:alpha/beta hydrolase family protein [Deinococcus radiophilus]|uniref:alpha/beta hydrolase family protein n=1 Tax=Deinococcus radiophilus TaxID=32062 RepID=UPI001E4A2968|nr:prolyl oligopeptidase family serine peptidase [Deinococcus radiophilus]UFA50480.1 prolyl oligopeptidase family serine peptidase [Deinococcus radiophilus]
MGDYSQLAYEWPHDVPVRISAAVRQRRIDVVNRYGTPKDNPEFWAKLSANSYLRDLSGPLQLHIGTADKEVPTEFHTRLAQRLRDLQKPVASYVYPNDDHNLSRNLNVALERSVAWFKRYL